MVLTAMQVWWREEGGEGIDDAAPLWLAEENDADEGAVAFYGRGAGIFSSTRVGTALCRDCDGLGMADDPLDVAHEALGICS